jgi:predicted alpha-1,2-mannosidase
MEVSEDADEFGAFKKMPKMDAEENWTKYSDSYKAYPGYTLTMAGDNIGTYFTYNLEEDKDVFVKIGISYTSTENAWENLKAEQENHTFNEIVGKATLIWEDYLSRIEVKSESKDDKTIFYTALYHILLHPNILQDVNGDFPKMGSYETSNSGDKNRYTVFSLWDTYRNVHPFLSLVYPELQLDMVNSMLDMSKETGWLPKWELLSMETNVMVGDPAIPVIADTYLRGLKEFDFDYAYEIARKGATTQENNPLRPGIKDYINLGFIPEGGDHGVWGTVSTNLEYNISDWNLSKMAGIKGNLLDQSMFFDRSMNYKNYFDRRTKMLRPRYGDRSWLDPFNPEAGKNFEAVVGFVEGNAWQYRFYVPHDIPGLIRLLGGEQSFVIALNRCFNSDNYDMANEPDITYAFLYNHVEGEEWRSQEKVPELIRTHYKNSPDGIPGNDDTGTLSAWLAFASIGIYPHCPGNTEYTITPPIFDEITIHLDQKYYEGAEIKIIKKPGRENKHIRKVKWNGTNHDSYFIDHNLLVQGGELQIIMK